MTPPGLAGYMYYSITVILIVSTQIAENPEKRWNSARPGTGDLSQNSQNPFLSRPYFSTAELGRLHTVHWTHNSFRHHRNLHSVNRTGHKRCRVAIHASQAMFGRSGIIWSGPASLPRCLAVKRFSQHRECQQLLHAVITPGWNS
jgi:hypothetical protein